MDKKAKAEAKKKRKDLRKQGLLPESPSDRPPNDLDFGMDDDTK